MALDLALALGLALALVLALPESYLPCLAESLRRRCYCCVRMLAQLRHGHRQAALTKEIQGYMEFLQLRHQFVELHTIHISSASL